MKVLVLMTRPSDYMLNCFDAWRGRSGIELTVVHKRIDTDQAPYSFDFENTGVRYYERESLDEADLQDLVRSTSPDLIVSFGWADKGYLRAIRARPRHTCAVMTMDNQWHGTARQMLGLLWGRVNLTRLFDFVWVPGERQRRFARLLGFSDASIRTRLLVANDRNFAPIRNSFEGAPKKRLIFVGRYVPEKGLRELWQGFIDYHDSTDSELELLCIGTGALFEERPQHRRIRHLGFAQPEDFPKALSGGGIFILPSHFEPWGLVVHEFAMAGCPLVLSRAVGAGDQFLGPDNGFLIDEVSPKAIEKAIRAVDDLDESTLAAMSRASAARAGTLTVSDWCDQADEFLAAVT